MGEGGEIKSEVGIQARMGGKDVDERDFDIQ
jgi:hypothetical protein